MVSARLTRNDDAVLSQIFDPESASSAGLLVDASLSEDPHIVDPALWKILRQRETSVILQVESILKNKEPQSSLDIPLKEIQQLISIYPDAACLLNDYAQILRTMHGNDLVSGVQPELVAQVYRMLDKAIILLTPSIPSTAISPVQCRTLAQAHTQRGALLHGLARTLLAKPDIKLEIPGLYDISAIHLQEIASRDFFMGGRYGNELGKALAVRTNPTAKLCGQMLQNAMREEFAKVHQKA